MGVQRRKPTNTHQHLQIHRTDYKNNQWAITMDAPRHNGKPTRPKKCASTFLPRPPTKNQRQLRRHNNSRQPLHESRFRGQQRNILQHVPSLSQHQRQKQIKDMGQKIFNQRRFPRKTKKKNRPMGVHGNLQTTNRWIPTRLEYQRSNWTNKIQTKKQATTCLQLDPNNISIETPFQIAMEWNDLTEDPDSEWTTISAYVFASNNYLKRTLEQTITTVTQLKTQIKTSLDTMNDHNKQLQDLPTIAAHIQNNVKAIQDLNANVQQVDENMQTIAPTIQQNITNI